MDYKKILTDIARAIVDTPEEVKVEETVEENEVKLLLTVAPDDTGMVIGRHGKIAKAIRTVIKAASANSGKKVIVDIEDQK